MTDPNSSARLFDRDMLWIKQRRALQLANDQSWFLHDHAAGLISERLTEVNRTFKKPAIIGWQAKRLARLLASDFGIDADCVEAADTLGLDVGHYDLVVHFMTLHQANDPVGQLIQMRRALCPDGLMITALLGGQTLAQLRTSLAEAETSLTGGLSPRIHPMADMRDLGALLQRAGFAMPVADNFNLQVTYRSLRHLVGDLRAIAETNILRQKRAEFTPRRLFDIAEEIYARSFSKDARLLADFELVFLTGWAFAEDQPKPLKPGSATTRLADFLDTKEYDPTRDTSA